MPKRQPIEPFRDIRAAAVTGIATLVAVLATAGVWAATAPLAGAVIAPAQVVVESNVRRIQHPSGGVVAAIRVNDGDHVRTGDVLVLLDETIPRANLAVVANQLNQLRVRQARLEAERDGREAIRIPAAVKDHADDPAIAEIIQGETTLFETRRAAIVGLKSQLRERIAQTGEEIRGLAAQIESKREQIRLIQEELKGVRQLYSANLVPYSRLTALEREAARLTGEEGQFIADTARARGRVTETELQIIQLDQDQRREVATDLREAENKIAELAERQTAAIDQLERVELRAPQDGIIHQKSIHTIGGVVAAGEQMMLVVPEKDGLVVEARIEPQMIDRLKVGQPVKLRFTAFDSATTPDIDGTLSRIAADLTKDQQSGVSYYTARVAIAEAEFAKLDGKILVPGMPVEAYIQTGSRTALAYLLKPIEDQLARTFRYD